MNTETYGSGTPVVFIHGAGGSALSWLFQKAYLERSNRVVLVDLPGHGRSDGPSSSSIDAYAEAVGDALEAIACGPAYIAGHSMGGAVAMRLAMSRPSLVKGLILIGTGAKLKVYPEILEGILTDKEATARTILDTAFSDAVPASLKDKVFTEYMKNDALTIFNDFTACDGFDLMGRLDAIAIPTLVICGTADRFTPPRYSRYLAGTIAGASLELIADAGHMVMIEKPAEVNAAIDRFVNSRE
jgi:pimeloyl-ACP methyl ester carboxylesterase